MRYNKDLERELQAQIAAAEASLQRLKEALPATLWEAWNNTRLDIRRRAVWHGQSPDLWEADWLREHPEPFYPFRRQA